MREKGKHCQSDEGKGQASTVKVMREKGKHCQSDEGEGLQTIDCKKSHST